MKNYYTIPGALSVPGSKAMGWVKFPPFELNAVRITVIYLFFGLSALFVSDVLIVSLLEDPLLAQVQALKGAIEVLLTGGLIFVLTRSHQRQQNQVASRMKRQRDELQLLHRIMRHNLRNDLNVLLGIMNLLADEEESGDTTELRQQAREKIKGMEEYIDQLRRVRMVTSAELDTVTIQISDVITSLLGNHSDIADDVEVSLSLPEDITVECNPMLEEGINELLTNAVHHNTAENPEVDIEVDGNGGPPGMVAIHISDNGPGLPSTEIEAIQARRAEELSQTLHSTGLGLWFVDWMITHSGGDLQVDGSDPEGTRITLLVPKA